jgi:FkbM family methyltransferase
MIATTLGRKVRTAIYLIARRALPPEATWPITAGPLRGMRWAVASGHAGHALGLYEPAMAREFARHLTTGATVYDVGAHAGHYTLLAARVVGPRGHVVAFEPLPRNLRYLERNVSANKLAQVCVVPAAVSDRTGNALFATGSGDPDQTASYMGRLVEGGGIPIRTLTLDDFIAGGSVAPPDAMKIDVEGAELAVLAGGRGILAAHRPLIFLATHGDALRAGAEALLSDLGYTVRALAEDEDRSDLLATPL